MVSCPVIYLIISFKNDITFNTSCYIILPAKISSSTKPAFNIVISVLPKVLIASVIRL